MHLIEFDGVEKRYPDGTLAVESLSFGVREGETVVFVGPSGCGKTTSLRMINRMIEPTAGTIRIGGVDVTTRPKAELRRGIGYVIQNAGLFPHRTVLQNVMTVPRLNGVSAAKARTRGMELLELVGLPSEFANRFPTQLSGGQQQRVGVARALAAEPKVLLMDEPFSALDPVVRAELQDEFGRLGHDLGTTIVFVTHDIDEAIRLGDRIAVFERGGRLAQVATPGELLAAPANEFVAQFVGRDRGYRALSFTDFEPGALRTIATQRPGSVTTASDSGWFVQVDDGGLFQGWRNAAAPDAPVHTVGSVRAGDTLRAALDAVLTSPSGEAAVLDAAGNVLGAVNMAELSTGGLESAIGQRGQRRD